MGRLLGTDFFWEVLFVWEIYGVEIGPGDKATGKVNGIVDRD